MTTIYPVGYTGPNIVPDRVKPLQLDLALIDLGYYTAVRAYAGSGTLEEQARFFRAEYMYRNDPFLVAGATALGLSNSEIDQVFILAATK